MQDIQEVKWYVISVNLFNDQKKTIMLCNSLEEAEVVSNNIKNRGDQDKVGIYKVVPQSNHEFEIYSKIHRPSFYKPNFFLPN